MRDGVTDLARTELPLTTSNYQRYRILEDGAPLKIAYYDSLIVQTQQTHPSASQSPAPVPL